MSAPPRKNMTSAARHATGRLWRRLERRFNIGEPRAVTRALLLSKSWSNQREVNDETRFNQCRDRGHFGSGRLDNGGECTADGSSLSSRIWPCARSAQLILWIAASREYQAPVVNVLARQLLRPADF